MKETVKVEEGALRRRRCKRSRANDDWMNRKNKQMAKR